MSYQWVAGFHRLSPPSLACPRSLSVTLQDCRIKSLPPPSPKGESGQAFMSGPLPVAELCLLSPMRPLEMLFQLATPASLLPVWFQHPAMSYRENQPSNSGFCSSQPIMPAPDNYLKLC